MVLFTLKRLIVGIIALIILYAVLWYTYFNVSELAGAAYFIGVGVAVLIALAVIVQLMRLIF